MKNFLDFIQGNCKIGEYVEYSPDKKELWLFCKETGYRSTQIVLTEPLRWQYVGTINKKRIIMAETSKYAINVQDIGVLNINRILDQICRECYSNEYFELNAQALSKEIFEQLLDKFKKGIYWVNSEEFVACYAENSLLSGINGYDLVSLPFRPVVII